MRAAAPLPAALRAPAESRPPRTVALWEPNRPPGSPRGGKPPPPPPARAAFAAPRLRGGGGGTFAQHSGFLEERAHGVGRRRPLGQPRVRLLGVHLDNGRVSARVVVADRRHEPSVPGGTRVRHDDPEVGLPLPPHPPQPNTSRHKRVTSFVRACASAGTVPTADSLPAPVARRPARSATGVTRSTASGPPALRASSRERSPRRA